MQNKNLPSGIKVLLMLLLVRQHPYPGLFIVVNQIAPTTWRTVLSVKDVCGSFCSHCPEQLSWLHLYQTKITPFSLILSI
jgi:hypothetical protein